ncbi:MAG: hypothetical protein AAF944_26250 [Bacteroidota bacterium]
MPIHLPNTNAKLRIFKGAPNSPFLAPRGVHLLDGKLFVSDTGQNRVFIWNQSPTEEFQPPDIVLGQDLSTSTGRNQGGGASASSLQYPSGLWSDGKVLAIADAWNHRILIWHTFPTQPGQPADVVLGQKDFSANEPNQKGVGGSPSEYTLYWPYGLTSDGKHLWVADTGNRRVLYYDQIPVKNNTPADKLIGKDNFQERDYDHHQPIWPYSVKLSPPGQLAITDTQYYRVLLWEHWQDAFDQSASVIIGQPDWEANGQNQFGLFPRANTLNWCYDSCFDNGSLWVADTGNSRLLRFDKLPQQHNRSADSLIGPKDFTTGSENAETINGTDETLYWPFSVAICQHTMAIADTGNHRIVLIDNC